MGIGVLGELWRCPVLHEARDNEKRKNEYSFSV